MGHDQRGDDPSAVVRVGLPIAEHASHVADAMAVDDVSQTRKRSRESSGGSWTVQGSGPQSGLFHPCSPCDHGTADARTKMRPFSSNAPGHTPTLLLSG